ncbi:MAG: hypothetical protein IJH62_02080 [Mogibacterium sp.]|nr:hypothetical protein [Mogibacterium sp.]
MADNTDNKQNIYREKTLERISAPDQLTDYLKVTNPGIWVVLTAVIILLVGVFVWSCVGDLETKSPSTIIVKDKTARVATRDMKELTEGDELRLEDKNYDISSVTTDEFGRKIGIASVDLPDGVYDGIVIVEKTHPIEFLTRSDT